MYFEFYIDRYFAEQFLVDYLLLNAAAAFCREKRSGRRLAAGSLAGASVTTVTLLLGKTEIGFAGIIAASALAFWRKGLRLHWQHNFICTAATLFMTVGFGGALGAVFSLAELPFLAGVFLSFVLLRETVRFCRKSRQNLEHTAAVSLTFEGHTVELQALIDTGNHLRAPITDRPVSIVNRSCVQKLIAGNYLERKGFCLIPYHSLGIGTGWMKGIVPDEMKVCTKGGSLEVSNPLIALYEGNVCANGGWQMILHPEHVP